MAGKIGFVVGIDQENSVHVHYPAADEVRVYNVSSDYDVGDHLTEEDVDHVERLEGRPLKAWMEFVDVRRGWSQTTHRAPDFGGESR
jgi:hypothetical protein